MSDSRPDPQQREQAAWRAVSHPEVDHDEVGVGTEVGGVALQASHLLLLVRRRPVERW
jgi:hypothetical protein